MKWAIDIDGVITGNPGALSWLTYHLTKNENKHEVYIISWRDGSDGPRKLETTQELLFFNVKYTHLIMAPRKFPNARVAAYWKIATIRKFGIDIWLDDEIKSYTRDYHFDLDTLLPDTIKIHI